MSNVSFKGMGPTDDPNIMIKYLQEESECLLEIRNILSDIELSPGVTEYAIACPQGIVDMVRDLKEKYITLTNKNH